jgi:hypothetical protein
MNSTNKKTGTLAKRLLALVLSLAMTATFLTGLAGAAGYHDKDSNGDDSGKFYLLTGRDNFEAGLDLGLLATKLVIPDGTNNTGAFAGIGDLRPAFGDAAQITYDELYRLVGSPELDYALISAPPTIALNGVAWSDVQAWLYYVGAPISTDNTFISDLDADKDGVLSIAEQLSLVTTPHKQALGFVSVHVGVPDEPFSVTLEYPDTAGYNTINKINDYQLTDTNNVIIPARFNAVRDDILITSRTKLTSSMAPGVTTGIVGNPKFQPRIALTVTSDGGTTGDIVGDLDSPQSYVNSVTALHMTPAWSIYTGQWWNIIKGAAQTYNGSSAQAIITAFFNVPGGQYAHTGVNTTATNFNALLLGLANGTPSGITNDLFGFGAQVKLNGFYRQGLGATATDFGDAESTWQATDADREANAIELMAVESDIINNVNSGSLATPNVQKLHIEVTRPWIESGDVFSLTFNPAEQDFDDLLGIDSIKIHDDGVLPAANAGKLQYVGVDNANITVGVRIKDDTLWTLYNLSTDVATLKSDLADILADAGGDIDVELVYLYAAADAAGNVGLFPDEIAKNDGAYAAPLLRTVTLTGLYESHKLYMKGYPDKTFQPNGNITRAEVAVILYNVLDQDLVAANRTTTNSFTDVPSDFWGNIYVSTVAKIGLIKGYPDGSYQPGGAITRTELAAIVSNLIPKLNPTPTPGNENIKYSDVDDDFWGSTYVYKVTLVSWMLGRSATTFEPQANLTRAEAATVFNRILNRAVNTQADLLPGMVTFPDNADTSSWYYYQVQEATNSHEYIRKPDGRFETWVKLLK